MIRLHTDGAVNTKTGKVGIGFVVAGDSLYHQVANPLSAIIITIQLNFWPFNTLWNG